MVLEHGNAVIVLGKFPALEAVALEDAVEPMRRGVIELRFHHRLPGKGRQEEVRGGKRGSGVHGNAGIKGDAKAFVMAPDERQALVADESYRPHGKTRHPPKKFVAHRLLPEKRPVPEKREGIAPLLKDFAVDAVGQRDPALGDHGVVLPLDLKKDERPGIWRGRVAPYAELEAPALPGFVLAPAFPIRTVEIQTGNSIAPLRRRFNRRIRLHVAREKLPGNAGRLDRREMILKPEALEMNRELRGRRTFEKKRGAHMDGI